MNTKITICIYILILGLTGCGLSGANLERAMNNCKDVIELEKLKVECYFNQNCYKTISNRQREVYFKANPNLPEKIKKCILSRKLMRGMDVEQVILCWGSPRKINTSTGSWGKHDQWVYYSTEYNINEYKYVYFENGILTSWQY